MKCRRVCSEPVKSQCSDVRRDLGPSARASPVLQTPSHGALVTYVTAARRHARPSEAVEAVNTLSNPQDQRSEHPFLLFGRGMHAGGGQDAAGKLKEA